MGAAHYEHEQMFELLVREVLCEWNNEANLLRHSLESNIEKIKYTLASGVNINSASVRAGWTPLHCAAYRGHENVVKLLLKFRKRNNSAIQVNKAALNGDTPLIIAEFKGHAAVVDELLGREVIELDQALFTAAMNGRDESVALLLSNESIDVNKATHDGTTPLLIAAENGHNKVVQMLLAHTGIEINKARFDGATPLCLAAKFGH